MISIVVSYFNEEKALLFYKVFLFLRKKLYYIFIMYKK